MRARLLAAARTDRRDPGHRMCGSSASPPVAAVGSTITSHQARRVSAPRPPTVEYGDRARDRVRAPSTGERLQLDRTWRLRVGELAFSKCMRANGVPELTQTQTPAAASSSCASEGIDPIAGVSGQAQAKCEEVSCPAAAFPARARSRPPRQQTMAQLGEGRASACAGTASTSSPTPGPRLRHCESTPKRPGRDQRPRRSDPRVPAHDRHAVGVIHARGRRMRLSATPTTDRPRSHHRHIEHGRATLAAPVSIAGNSAAAALANLSGGGWTAGHLTKP